MHKTIPLSRFLSPKLADLFTRYHFIISNIPRRQRFYIIFALCPLFIFQIIPFSPFIGDIFTFQNIFFCFLLLFIIAGRIVLGFVDVFYSTRQGISVRIVDVMVLLLALYVFLLGSVYGSFSLDYYMFFAGISCYFMLRQVPLTKSIERVFVFAVSFLTVYHSSFVIIDYLKHGKAEGMLNHSSYAGMYLSVLATFLTSHLTEIKTQRTKRLFLFLIITSVCAIAITLSRTAWLALALCAVAVFEKEFHLLQSFKHFFSNSKTSQKVLFCFGMSSLGIGLICVALFVYNIKPDSVSGRFLIWKVSIMMIEDGSFFGSGPGTFQNNYSNYQALYFENNEYSQTELLNAGFVKYSFSEYLQLIYEWGVPGSLLLLLTLCSIFSFKKGFLNTFDRSCILSLVCIIIMSFFSYPLHMFLLWIFFWVFIGALANKSVRVFRIELDSRSWIIGSSTGLLVLCCLFLFFCQHLKIYHKWLQAYEDLRFTEYDASSRKFDSIFPFLKDNGQFLMHYGKALNLSGRYNESIQVLELAKNKYCDPAIYLCLGDSYRAVGDFKSAEKSYEKSLNMIPNRLYPRYLLAELFVGMGDDNRVNKICKEALAMPTKIQSYETLMLKEYFIKKVK